MANLKEKTEEVTTEETTVETPEQILERANDYLSIANDSRSIIQEKVDTHRKQYAGILTQQVDDRGKRLTTINFNKTKTAVRTSVDNAVRAFLRGEAPLRVKPKAPDDVDTPEAIETYLIESFKNIDGIEELISKYLLQTLTVGSGACKIRYDKYYQKIYFNWILFENAWFDNAECFANIRYAFERIPTLERDLRRMVKNGEYNKEATERFIEARKEKGEDVRAKTQDDIKKPISEKQGKDFYDVIEYWWEDDVDEKGKPIWKFCTLGCVKDGDSYKAIEVLQDPTLSSYCYGHPYINGIAYFDPLTVYGIGIPEDIRDVQRLKNIIGRQRIDYVNKMLNPPTMIDEGTFRTSQDLTNFQNWRLGKVSMTRPGMALSGVKIVDVPPLSPAIFNTEAELDNEAEVQARQPGVLTGEQAARREPAATTQRRISLASQSVDSQVWILAMSFYKPMLKKFLLCKQQFWNDSEKGEFIRITGDEGEKWLQLSEQRLTPEDVVIGKDYQLTTGGRKYKTFHFGASSDEAIKMYDIELVPDYELESKQQLKQKMVEYTQMLVQLAGVSKAVQMNINWLELTRQLLKTGFINTHKIFNSPDSLPQEIVAQITALWHKNPQGFIGALMQIPVPAEEGEVEKGLPKQQPQMGGVPAPMQETRTTPEVQEQANIMRSEALQ